MKKISKRRVAELAKYVFGCASSVLTKLVVVAFFTWLAFPVWIGYLGAQVVVLITGYLYHSNITFHPELRSWRERFINFGQFTLSVLVFKIADYLLVVIGAEILSRHLEAEDVLTPWMRQGIASGLILIVSGMIFFIRYFWYRALFQSRRGEGCDEA